MNASGWWQGCQGGWDRQRACGRLHEEQATGGGSDARGFYFALLWNNWFGRALPIVLSPAARRACSWTARHWLARAAAAQQTCRRGCGRRCGRCWTCRRVGRGGRAVCAFAPSGFLPGCAPPRQISVAQSALLIPWRLARPLQKPLLCSPHLPPAGPHQAPGGHCGPGRGGDADVPAGSQRQRARGRVERAGERGRRAGAGGWAAPGCGSRGSQLLNCSPICLLPSRQKGASFLE